MDCINPKPGLFSFRKLNTISPKLLSPMSEFTQDIPCEEKIEEEPSDFSDVLIIKIRTRIPDTWPWITPLGGCGGSLLEGWDVLCNGSFSAYTNGIV